MARTVKAIPRGYHTVTPSLMLKDCASALDYYRKLFGAEEKSRMLGPDGTVAHAELVIGDSVLMFSEENQQMGMPAPTVEHPCPITLTIYTDDAQKLWNRAIATNVKVGMEFGEQFWGDRYGSFSDAYGYKWAIGQHVKDMTDAEIDVAMKEFMAAYDKH